MPVALPAKASTTTIVVRSQRLEIPASSHQLSDFVANNCLDNLFAIRLSTKKRLRKFHRLFNSCFWWHRRFELIDDSFDNHRARCIQSLLDSVATGIRILDGKANASAGVRKRSKIDGL